jgi:hypothetical protein
MDLSRALSLIRPSATFSQRAKGILKKPLQIIITPKLTIFQKSLMLA